MAKKVFAMYLAKEGNPNSDAYAKLDLPASPLELWDALDKVRLQTDDILYMEIEDYFAFEYLSPHLDGLDISLNELNDLAAQLAALDEVQEVAFDGFLRMEVQNKVDTNGGVITMQDTAYLSQAILTAIQGTLDDNNNRLCRILFKCAGEQNMMSHTIAAHFRTDPIHTRELRAYAVDEVKRTNGQVSFENAVRSQRRIEPDDTWPGSY